MRNSATASTAQLGVKAEALCPCWQWQTAERLLFSKWQPRLGKKVEGETPKPFLCSLVFHHPLPSEVSGCKYHGTCQVLHIQLSPCCGRLQKQDTHLGRCDGFGWKPGPCIQSSSFLKDIALTEPLQLITFSQNRNSFWEFAGLQNPWIHRGQWDVLQQK